MPAVVRPARRTRRTPKLRHHHASNQAFVEVAGRYRYLGPWGHPETKQRYHAFVAEYLARDGWSPVEPEELAVAELLVGYIKHAEAHYRKPDGTPTSELKNVKLCVGIVDDLYGHLPAAGFGPPQLKAVRARMIERGWSRKSINVHVGRVRRVFRWAVSEGLVPPDVWNGLRAVAPLKAGRTEARETEPVRPVPEAWIDAVRPFVSEEVEALIDLQLLTGMRPGEAVLMRGCDLDTSSEVWTYTPGTHKTEHHGHARTVFLGPRAQEIVRRFLKPDTSAYLLSPADAEARRRAEQHAARSTPMSCGNVPGSNNRRRPERVAGDRYTVGSYRRAVAEACDAAFPPEGDLARKLVPGRGRKHKSLRVETLKEWRERLAERWSEVRAWRRAHRWSVNRLRHNAATALRREYGIDVAQTILGHRIGSSVTEIYAEANTDRARDVMKLVG